MYYIGLDIGSTTSKYAIINDDKQIIDKGIFPTGWSSVEAATLIKENIEEKGVKISKSKLVATGYGRASVHYANKTLSEISCHGKGAVFLFGDSNSTIIDIGGQDVKIISLKNGKVSDFLMNDKCSAGTGRFLEVMSNIMGVRIDELCALAAAGGGVSISSMCTVFAESEVISLIGMGKSKEDIAFGVVESICDKVKTLSAKHTKNCENIFLTGGLHKSDYIIKRLSDKLGSAVQTHNLAQYAGALGAAVSAMKIS